ncbi:MAG: hypothetical protein LBU91_03035 [Bacteroidales bacterium]|jgi:hypothetical protein|nr:hypothetical protein [Bacteroidales bacterium]
MKFCNIIFKRSKQIFIILFFTSITTCFYAQNASISPYSRFGIGELQTVQNPRNVAMGGLGVGLTEAKSISSTNPASYLNLDSLSVMFEVNFQGIYSQLSEKQADATVGARTNRASLGQIALTFPITSWLKSSFGLLPGSNMSYSVTREYSVDTIGRYMLENSGNGGLNQVFLGLSAGTSRIAFGVNVNYNFGSFVRNSVWQYVDTILSNPTSTHYLKSLDARGVSFDFGLQYRQPLSKNYQLGLGLSYTPKAKLKASKNNELYSVTTSSNTVPIDIKTIENGTLELPDRYTAGLSFEKLNRWVIGVEYTGLNYSNYREFSEADQNLSDAYTIRTGMELKGQHLDNQFMNRLSYRVGYHYGTNYVTFGNSEIKEFGVSFGIGMPIRRSNSRVDVGVEFGRKGRVANGQIQENYGRIVIGISAFDRWFIRGKFD